jgi:hypothetical protein
VHWTDCAVKKLRAPAALCSITDANFRCYLYVQETPNPHATIPACTPLRNLHTRDLQYNLLLLSHANWQWERHLCSLLSSHTKRIPYFLVSLAHNWCIMQLVTGYRSSYRESDASHSSNQNHNSKSCVNFIWIWWQLAQQIRGNSAALEILLPTLPRVSTGKTFCGKPRHHETVSFTRRQSLKR